MRAVSGNLVHLDELVTMEAGRSYGLRFRVFADPEDTIGASVVRSVLLEPGETDLLTLTGEGDLPAPGDIVHFGESGTDSWQVIVSHIEATEDQCSISSLKTERTARKGYRTRDEPALMCSTTSSASTPTRRRYSKLGYLSPMEFEARAMLH